MSRQTKLFEHGGGLLRVQSQLLNSPFFLVATVLGIVCSALNIYVVIGHWQSLAAKGALLLPLFAGIQFVNVWWRALRYERTMRLLSTQEISESPKQKDMSHAILAVAAGGLTDLLLWFFITNVAMLIYIDTVFTL